MNTHDAVRLLLLAFLTSCTNYPTATSPSADALAPDEPAVDADATATGGAIYAFDRLHSPIDTALAKRLQALATGHRANVFAKIGDSITDAYEFLYCFDGGPDLASYSTLAATVAFFDAGNAAGGSPFARDSFAAIGGSTAADALAGSPSRIDRELSAIDPQLALVMFGANDVAAEVSVDAFGTTLWTMVESLVARGVVPIPSTFPPNNRDAVADRRIEIYNLVVRAIAQGQRVPLVDYHRALLALPQRGLSQDGIHPSVAPSGACDLRPSALAYGYNLRNLLTLEALARVRAALADAPADALALRSGRGTRAEPFLATLPLADQTTLQDATPTALCGVPTTRATTTYRLDLATPALVEVQVVDRDATDVDVYLADATRCESGDTAVSATVSGSVTITVAGTTGDFIVVARTPN